MDFLRSLPMDMKLIAGGIAVFAVLLLLSGNRKSEQRYLVVLALLAVAGFYRYERPAAVEASVPAISPEYVVTAPAKPAPLVSTSAK